jgi:myo-inositol-1(or 4)-monophosphatase
MSDGKKPEVDDLIGFGMDFIHQAGENAMTFYGKGRPQVKFDQGVVTEAEIQLTELFKDQLRLHFPEHQLFSVDAVSQDYSHEGKRYLWAFDPLEGVANFQAGIPLWGLSLALLENFWPVFGVFFMPATGDLFHARAGCCAYWGRREITIPSPDGINDESMLLTYSRFHQHYRSTFPGKIRSLGCTSAHLCYVAMGRADAALIANESFQGLAAARVIVEAAGGKFSKLDGSEFFLNEYLDGQKIDDHVLVAAPDNLPLVRKCLKRVE